VLVCAECNAAAEQIKTAGIFPEIHHAYFTIDTTLWLWDYEHAELAPFPFNEVEQAIVSVALLPPKRNCFDADVTHVLAIATLTQVVLVAIVPRTPGPGLSLRTTQYAIATQNVGMVKMIGTEHGRLFMCGDDGNLHEFSYHPAQASVGLWEVCRSKKPRDIIHGKRFHVIYSLVPSFLRFQVFDYFSALVIGMC
jgi:hypothetical protein